VTQLRKRSGVTSKPFPDLKTDEEAEDWLQNANLTEYDLSDLRKVRFEQASRFYRMKAERIEIRAIRHTPRAVIQ
jgi:predicted DNA binding CopG/RHH family protein